LSSFIVDICPDLKCFFNCASYRLDK